MSLRILTTGGTFDKRYDPITGQLGFAASAAPDLLERARLAEAVTLEALMALDSLDMTDAHRQTILAACRASAESRIVILHGTDTLVETARVLGAARLPATIVLTGAMVRPRSTARTHSSISALPAPAHTRCPRASGWP